MFYAMKMKSFPVSGVKSNTMHSTILENMRYASNKNMASRRLMSQGAQQNVKSNVNESSSLLSRFANKYLYYLDHYPIPVKAVTAGCMVSYYCYYDLHLLFHTTILLQNNTIKCKS